MIKFYPRNIELWRNIFDFSISDAPHKKFNDMFELIDFLYKCGNIKIADPDNRLSFYYDEYSINGKRIVVHQWTVLGWIYK